MKTRYTVFSLILLVSMVLSACTAATTQAPVPTTAPTQPAAPAATNTVAPAAATAVPATKAPTVAPTATKVPRQGGWLDQIVFTSIADAPSAVAQLQAGAIDMYPVSATDPNVFKTVKADKNLTYATTYGSNDQMILNTVECTDKNILNPFTSMAIREALNYAIDRNYISQEIQGGLAIPKFTGLNGAFPDAARYAAEMATIATKYAYNLDTAQKVVDAEMTKMGATKDAAGKFQYKGKPVTIIGLIRTEDSRKQIGEYFANQLEKLGFTVDRQEKVRKEAAPIWQGDPAPCKFGYYTAGWISTAIERDMGYDFAQFNSGLVQNIPLFLKYQPSKELSAAQDPLLTNNFKNFDERDALFKTAFDLSMKESWWGVWVIDLTAFAPMKANVSVSSDLALGPGNALFGYTVRFTDKEGGTMRVAQSGVLVQAWNPVQGSNWVDDGTIQQATSDHGWVSNPFTGLRIPKLLAKADVTVKTGLPVTKTLDWVSLKFADTITVPDDAWADWDAKTQTFITAKDRLANAKAAAAKDPKAPDAAYSQAALTETTVTYNADLFKTKWHDGSTFSVADVVMDMILTFDPGKPDSKIYDKGYADSTLATYMTHFKGVKIVSTNPLTITTWDDTYALDAENMAASWYPATNEGYLYGTGAWHNLTLSVMAEADGKMAFSLDKSTEKKVDETSLISGPTLALQVEYLTKVAATGDLAYAPTLSTYVKADEAKARYANLQKWYAAHNNLWIGTGVYYVDKVDATAGSVTLANNKDYMFSLDPWTVFGKPQIAAVTVDGPAQVKAGDEAVFNVAVTFGGKPYASKDLASVAYTLFGSDGSVVDKGDAKMTAEGKYTVTLSAATTGKLPAGATKLSIGVASKLVSLPTFAVAEFVTLK